MHLDAPEVKPIICAKYHGGFRIRRQLHLQSSSVHSHASSSLVVAVL